MFGHNDQDDKHENEHQDEQRPLGGLGTPPILHPDDTSLTASHPGIPNDDSSHPSAPDDDLASAPLNDDQPLVSPTNDLLDLKSKALHQLAPLVGHLDQSPEEKFKTTMMMIQASDNQSLIKDAYEAAQQIPDEKTKAQALLDVVNEINYFTQHQTS